MKPLGEMSFEELVQQCQADITLSIPTGKFNEAIWQACDLALQWRYERDKYLRSTRTEEPK